MRQPVCLALVTTSLLVLSSAAAHAQALAPSTLDFTSHDQKTADDMVQVITSKSPQVIAKKREPVVGKRPTQQLTKELAQTTTKGPVRTFVGEPVRPIEIPVEKQSTSKTTWPFTRFSYKTPDGKKESVLVYGTNRTAGHVELRIRDGFVSDFCSKTPSRRPLVGIYAKM